MARAGKVAEFHKEGYDWYCSRGLPSDIIVVVDGVNFHLHKFPLVSKCGKMAHICEESQEKALTLRLEEFPGGPDTFLIAAKFCYGMRVELTPRNVVILYCAADYLEMTGEYGEDNLLPKSEDFFHRNVLRYWKDCILALQSSDPVIQRAEKLQIITKCLNALSMMVHHEYSLFGWPMMLYGSLQGPDGSILWNGINTGARIRSTESDWWFEDISCLSVVLFERLINTMESRGIIGAENLADAIMYYARKYLPGLGRWQSDQTGKNRMVAGYSLTPAAVDQKVLIEAIGELLPEKKGKSFCGFLLGVLRVALILGASQTSRYALERKIGMQLELATLDRLLIPTYSDSDTLYDTECVERIVNHFLSSESRITALSPSSPGLESSPSSKPLQKVAKLIDNYMAEVASDANLKPRTIRSLAELLPESSRSLHDGIYRALDIYFKAHPCLSEKEKEELCNMIDYQKLSIDACAHASQNERLPVRVVLKVLFFEQMQLRTALASCLHVLDAENAPMDSTTAPNETAGQILQRDGLVAIVRENQILKVDMEKMRSRLSELEEAVAKMKQEMRRVTRSHSYFSPRRLVGWKIGCKFLPRASDNQQHTVDSTGHTPRTSDEQAHSSLNS